MNRKSWVELSGFYLYLRSQFLKLLFRCSFKHGQIILYLIFLMPVINAWNTCWLKYGLLCSAITNIYKVNLLQCYFGWMPFQQIYMVPMFGQDTTGMSAHSHVIDCINQVMLSLVSSNRPFGLFSWAAVNVMWEVSSLAVNCCRS